MNKNFLINEEAIEIDLDKRTSSNKLKHIKGYREKLDSNVVNRLTHYLLDYDRKGSPILGEKIAALLLGAVNLNYYSKSYPFVDLKVKEPIKDITRAGEYISVKASSTQHSLSSSVTDVNGFKVSQLILFIIEKLPLEIFKNPKIQKLRGAIKKDAVLNVYYAFMNECKDKKLHNQLFMMQAFYIVLLQKYITDRLRTPQQDIKNLNEFYSIMFGIILNRVNNELGIDYTPLFRQILSSHFKRVDFNIVMQVSSQYVLPENIDISSFLPENIANNLMSYCILYLDPDFVGKKETNSIVLHLQKTRALTVKELLDRSIKLWMNLGHHEKLTRGKDKKNIYFTFKDVVKIFEPEKSDNSNIEFDVHLKVIISKEGSKKYTKRPEEQIDTIIKVIDEIKGLPHEEITDDVLSKIRDIIDLTKLKDRSKLNKFIRSFDDFYEPIRHPKKLEISEEEPETKNPL